MGTLEQVTEHLQFSSSSAGSVTGSSGEIRRLRAGWGSWNHRWVGNQRTPRARCAGEVGRIGQIGKAKGKQDFYRPKRVIFK